MRRLDGARGCVQAHTWGSCLDAPVPCWPLSREPWPAATRPLPHVSVFMARHLASSKTDDQREGENKSTKDHRPFYDLISKVTQPLYSLH